ncbi:MAG: 3-isopropylmalate dehydratase small subunit [Candidatus Hodarchaeota archaeon]
MVVIRGKVWKFGNSIDTDIIIPTRYLVLPIEEAKEKAMEPIRPSFPKEFEKGGIIVAGKNFGCGSSREQAPAVLKALGVSAIVAKSFARIFFRNAINLGIPTIECKEAYDKVEEGEKIEIEPETGKIKQLKQGTILQGSKLPLFLLEIIKDGGLIPHLKCSYLSKGTS